ncbi:hypothetical protein [Salinarimonas soli]|uniref:Uncharacterized protein n=1 Tax=Salinarimonas soli TaxID=1638099 RepID=A0A5B2VAS6_9HYPH|nr:hypothetical protein [Salinarimonas soli]KAA2236111.1 hypothetical protein F0L46_15450 [Salinarimonas soli]
MQPAPYLVAAFLAVSPTSGEDGMVQPWTHALATSIRDAGYGCAVVGHVAELGFENEGRVALVVCRGGFAPDEADHRAYRVVFYTEGDVTVRPWRQAAQR